LSNMSRLLLVVAIISCVFAVREIADDDLHKYTFEEYIADWGKSYPSHLDYSIHKLMFERRLGAIIRQNSDPYASWRAGINKFTDMTEAEFKAFRGYNINTALLSTTPRKSIPRVNDPPASVDWRLVPGVVTEVKDQGQCGSCWAFSATESLESGYAIDQNKTAPVLSPQNIVSCTPNPNQCGGTGGCGGATAELAFGWVRDHGIATNADWPYTATNGVCNAHPEVVTTTSFVALPANSYSDLLNAAAMRPVSVSVDASTWSIYKSGVYNCTSTTLDIDHAVQVVGYGTDSTTNPPKDYWIVRNSWGASWGEKGYIRLLKHSDADMKWCWPDPTPSDGSGCNGGPKVIEVCGTCGIWYDNSYPTGVKDYKP